MNGDKTQNLKNPLGFKQNLKKSHAEFTSHKNFQRNYAARIRGNYHEPSNCFEYPIKPLLKSSYPKKYLQKFPTQKIPKLKISNPKKSFDPPCHLKSGVPPWEYFRPPDTKQLVCRLFEAGTKNITVLSCILFLQNAQL